MKIGLPRALLYHSYGPFMESLSFRTSGGNRRFLDRQAREILDRGTSACVDDACLPVKVFAGHVESLRAKCDLIAVPRSHVMRIWRIPVPET